MSFDINRPSVENHLQRVSKFIKPYINELAHDNMDSYLEFFTTSIESGLESCIVDANEDSIPLRDLVNSILSNMVYDRTTSTIYARFILRNFNNVPVKIFIVPFNTMLERKLFPNVTKTFTFDYYSLSELERRLVSDVYIMDDFDEHTVVESGYIEASLNAVYEYLIQLFMKISTINIARYTLFTKYPFEVIESDIVPRYSDIMLAINDAITEYAEEFYDESRDVVTEDVAEENNSNTPVEEDSGEVIDI